MSTRLNTKRKTPAYRRTAISVPADLLAAADEAARERGESRSGFITRILRTAMGARRDAAITRRLNELFADETLHSEQSRGAAELDRIGTDWSDESW